MDKKVSGGEIKFVLAEKDRTRRLVRSTRARRNGLIRHLDQLVNPKLVNLKSVAAVSETIVREYFELHEFLVRQHRKYIAQTKREDDDIDFFVLNPHPQKRDAGMPFVLSSADLRFVERAVVVVKGWHTETFSPAVLAHAPEIFRFVEPKVFLAGGQRFWRGWRTEENPRRAGVAAGRGRATAKH